MSAAMNATVAAAGLLILPVALVHSVFGQRMIFRPWDRKDPSLAALRRFRGILWASWHLASVLAAGIGVGLVLLARDWHGAPQEVWLVRVLALAFLGSSTLVAIGTRGRHPGWIGLGLSGTLALLG